MTPRIRGFANVLIPGEAGQRAIEETLDDWREERAQAASSSARVLVNVRGFFSVLRVLCTVPLKDVVKPEVWRLFALTLLAASALALVPIVPYLQANVSRLSPASYAIVALALLPNGLATMVPVVLSLGLGMRRDRPAPVLATVFVSVVFLIVMFGWAVPAANHSYRGLVWESTVVRPGPPLAPGLAELSAPRLVDVALHGSTYERLNAGRVLSIRLALIAAGPTMFLLGVAIRNRFGRRRWCVAQASGLLAAVGFFVLGVPAAAWVLQLFDWPTATKISRVGADLWTTVGLAWLAIVVLTRTSEPRNPEPDQRTLNVEP